MKQTGPREAQARLEAKAAQAAKIAEIHTALMVTGYRTTAEQAFALGINRSTAWALFNHDDKAGPSAIVLKRILSSQNLPQEARLKVEEYIKEKSAGRYAHDARRVRWFRDQFPSVALVSAEPRAEASDHALAERKTGPRRNRDGYVFRLLAQRLRLRNGAH